MQLKQIATDAVNICKVQAQAKSIKLINHIGEREQVYADLDTISVVLRNIVSNAVKFTNPNGFVRLSSFTENGTIQIQITDTGIGIEPQKLINLFNLENNRTSLGTNNESGTGLGLIVCKEFVEQNKGKIWIDSTLGEGTTVSISLPV